MKTVFIATRHETDAIHTNEENLNRAKYACEHTMLKGLAPVCPRLFYTDSALDDGEERTRYRSMADAMIEACDEVHQYGASVDAVMAADLTTAARLGKPIKIYNSIGVPKKRVELRQVCGQPRIQSCLRRGRACVVTRYSRVETL